MGEDRQLLATALVHRALAQKDFQTHDAGIVLGTVRQPLSHPPVDQTKLLAFRVDAPATAVRNAIGRFEEQQALCGRVKGR